MKKFLKSLVRSAVQKAGYDIVRRSNSVYPPDFSAETTQICESVKPYTMTSPERLRSLIDAVQYVTKYGIDGAFVECGVWKGGSSMAMAIALRNLGIQTRDIYLYDTFTGMTAPGNCDISYSGEVAYKTFTETRIAEDASDWCLSPLEEVKKNLLSTGYNEDRIHFIKGKVEEVIPKFVPEEIALLRLDTDWYESTKHEMTHLFPLLKQNGVIIETITVIGKGREKRSTSIFLTTISEFSLIESIIQAVSL